MTNITTTSRRPAPATSHAARRRLVAAGVGLVLVGAACSGDTTENVNAPTAEPAVAESPTPEPDVVEDANDPDDVSATTLPPTPGTTTPPTTARATDSGGAVAEPGEPPAEPEPEPDPEPDPELATEGPCGAFGPIPPRPDSMPTVLFDTDGDGAIDDEVTAYGATDGWRVRVVEDGVTSEALMPTIMGWAHITGPILAIDGDQFGVRDAETDEVFRFRTGDDHCIVRIDDGPSIGPSDLVDPGGVVGPDPIEPIDDLTPTPSPEPVDGCWAPLAPIPADATIASELWVDYDGGGMADDHLVSYFDGQWKLRVAISGLEDEVVVPGAGVHGVRILGLANVGQMTPGSEIIAVVGGGASAVEIGVFGFSELSCLFRYATPSGDPFGVLTGATVMWGEGVVCEDGAIADWGYQREDDDTYTVWGAAFHEVVPGEFSYLPASDDYAEGLSFDDINPDLFDCNGLSL